MKHEQFEVQGHLCTRNNIKYDYKGIHVRCIILFHGLHMDTIMYYSHISYEM